MSWTTPPTAVTGALATAAEWNVLRDDLNDLNDRSLTGKFQGYSDAFSLGSGGGNTQMDLQHETQKVNMTHSTSVNPHLVFPNSSGLYRVSVYVVWQDVVGGVRFALLGMTGSDVKHNYVAAGNGGQATNEFTATCQAVGGTSYWYVQVWQNSGSSVSATVYLDVVREGS